MTNPKTLSLAALVLLAGSVWVVYSGALDSPFVFDDSVSVVKNPSITQLWPLINEAPSGGPLNPPNELPTSGRPLVNLSLALNYHFGQLDPAGYHLFNLIVHVLSALLLFAIVRRTLRLDYFAGRFQTASGPLALAVALLWALHPLQTETVIYITQRTELMVGFFYLATLYCSLHYWQAASPVGRNTWLAFATLACLGGMACKEVMVTAPVIVLLFDRTFIAGSFRQSLRRSWPLYIGLACSWALLLWLNLHTPRSTTAGFGIGISAYDWWLTQTKVFWMYLKLTVWPWPLSINYQIAYPAMLDAYWPWALAFVLLCIGTLFLFWRRSAIGFVGAWILIILSPTLVLPIITEVAAERRMYLPLVALVTLAVVGGYALMQKAAMRAPPKTGRKQPSSRWPEGFMVAIVVLLAVALGSVSARRLMAFHDPVTLWQDVLATQPDNFVANFNLGNIQTRNGNTSEALQHYQLAIQIAPQYAEAHNNYGLALLKTSNPQAALEQFQKALEIKPRFIEACANTALAHAAMNRREDAIATANKAIDMARSQGKIALAGEIEAWLKNYRAHSNPADEFRRSSPLESSP